MSKILGLQNEEKTGNLYKSSDFSPFSCGSPITRVPENQGSPCLRVVLSVSLGPSVHLVTEVLGPNIQGRNISDLREAARNLPLARARLGHCGFLGSATDRESPRLGHGSPTARPCLTHGRARAFTVLPPVTGFHGSATARLGYGLATVTPQPAGLFYRPRLATETVFT